MASLFRCVWKWFVGSIILAIVWGCAPRIDADDLRTCKKILPAINPSDVSLSITNAAPGPFPHSIRLDYEARESDGTSFSRFVTCSFVQSRSKVGKNLLAAVETDEEVMAPASLYFLKRFYLEAPNEAGADANPSVETSLTHQPDAKPPMTLMVGAAPKIFIYALLAAAYTLVFGLFGSIAPKILRQDSFIVALFIAALWGLADRYAVPISGVASGLLLALAGGLVAVRLTYRTSLPEGLSKPGLGSLVGLGGMASLIQGWLAINDPVILWLHPIWSFPMTSFQTSFLEITVTPLMVIVFSFGTALILFLLLMITETKFGQVWKLCASAKMLFYSAESFPLDEEKRQHNLRKYTKIYRIALILSVFCALFASALIVLQFGGQSLPSGFHFGLKALIVAGFIRFRSIPLTIAAGGLLGSLEAIVGAYLPTQWLDFAIYGSMAILWLTVPGRAKTA